MEATNRFERAILWEQSGFQPPEKSRERLLRVMEAALDSLYEVGFDRTSFESVGKRCRMRRSHVAYYFKTRDDLLEAVFRHVVGSAQHAVVAEIRRARTPIEMLRADVIGHFRWVERERKKAMVVFLFYFMSARTPQFSELHREIRRIGAERIRGILRSGFGMDARRSQVVAKNIQSLLTGALIDFFTCGQVHSLAAAERATLEGIDNLLGRAGVSATAAALARRPRVGEVTAGAELRT